MFCLKEFIQYKIIICFFVLKSNINTFLRNRQLRYPIIIVLIKIHNSILYNRAVKLIYNIIELIATTVAYFFLIAPYIGNMYMQYNRYD